MERHGGILPRSLRCEDGTSAVEFAIIAPIMLLLVFGVIAYGLYFGAVHSLQQLAAEAARASVAGLTNGERADLAQRTVTAALASPALLRLEDVTVAVGADPADPDVYLVSLSFDTRSLPVAPLVGLIPLPASVLTRTARVRRGGF